MRQVIREEIALGLGHAAQEPDELLTTKEMADTLGLHPDTITDWARNEEDCPAFRRGKRPYVWPRDATLDWLRRRNG